MIELLTLGTIEIRDHRDPDAPSDIHLPPKRLALLAYLAVSPPGTYHRRDGLVALLWPERNERSARRALTQSVYALRERLGKDAILTHGNEDVGLDPEAMWCDATAVEAALANGDLARALALYRGELLPGLHVGDCLELERWLDQQRLALAQRVAGAAVQLATQAAADEDRSATARWSRRALELSPYDEAALRVPVEALDAAGQRGHAVRAYEMFTERLRAELGAEPSPDTRALGQALHNSRGGRPGGAYAQPHAEREVAGPTVSGDDASSPGRSRTRVVWASALVLSVLLAAAVGYVLLGARNATTTRAPPAVAEAAPGIAVLPFDVRGDGARVWREGMVDVLARSLDGAAGLRTIASRTVLARWREAVGTSTAPDATEALDVARGTGARYAVLGSVVVSGERLRAVADAVDLETGRRLGEAQAEGPSDSVFAVVDRFAGEILRRIVRQRGEVPALDLSRATTGSLPALKAYLDGEVHLRRGAFEDAIGAYRRALEADSMFALAWLRLGDAYGWVSLPDSRVREEALARAVALVDRLPERDALLATGAHGLDRGSPESLVALRTATRKYPDDPLAWYLLGDFLMHQGGAFLAEPTERRRALERAIELDSTFSPAYRHVIHDAMRNDPDSAGVDEIIGTYERMAPGTPGARELRLAHALAFADDSTFARLVGTLDTVAGILVPFMADPSLAHPRFLARKATVLEAARRRADPMEAAWGARFLAATLLHRGHLPAALRALEHPLLDETRASLLYLAYVSGLPVPVERLEGAIAGSSAAELEADDLFARAAWDLEQGRADDYGAARVALRRLEAEALAAQDSLAVRQLRGAGRGLEGYAAWRRGSPAEAERLLEEARLLTAGGSAGRSRRSSRTTEPIAACRGIPGPCRLTKLARRFLASWTSPCYLTHEVSTKPGQLQGLA